MSGVASPEGLPRCLGDGDKRRYAYSPDDPSIISNSGSPFDETATPFLVALTISALPSSMQPQCLAGRDWDTLTASFKGLGILHCPSARRERWPTSFLQYGYYSFFVEVRSVRYASPWYTTSDYAGNSCLLGYHWDAEYKPVRAGGLVSRVRRPSTTLLAGECDDATFALTTRLEVSGGFDATLAGLMAAGPRPLGSPSAAQPVFDRHERKANFLFVDGHVELLGDTRALRDVRIVP